MAALGISALIVPAMGTEAAEIVSEGPAILYAAEESVNMSSGPGMGQTVPWMILTQNMSVQRCFMNAGTILTM